MGLVRPPITRRQFVGGVRMAGLRALAGRRVGWQGEGRARRGYRIAFLAGSAPRAHQDGLLWGLQDLGYVDGHNAIIERYYAQGRDDSLTALAAELAGRDLDVIVVPADP